jgi:hypothetical protein
MKVAGGERNVGMGSGLIWYSLAGSGGEGEIVREGSEQTWRMATKPLVLQYSV